MVGSKMRHAVYDTSGRIAHVVQRIEFITKHSWAFFVLVCMAQSMAWRCVYDDMVTYAG